MSSLFPVDLPPRSLLKIVIPMIGHHQSPTIESPISSVAVHWRGLQSQEPGSERFVWPLKFLPQEVLP